MSTYRAPDGTLQETIPLVDDPNGIGVIAVTKADAKGEFGSAPGALPARIVEGTYRAEDGTWQEPIKMMIDTP